MANRLRTEHRQIRTPRPDRLAVLFGEHARGLRNVAQVVCHPRREELPERDGPQFRVLSFERQLTV